MTSLDSVIATYRAEGRDEAFIARIIAAHQEAVERNSAADPELDKLAGKCLSRRSLVELAGRDARHWMIAERSPLGGVVIDNARTGRRILLSVSREDDGFCWLHGSISRRDRAMPTYGDMVVLHKMMGQRMAYQLLRDHQTRPGEKFLLLSGIRRAESKRRTKFKTPVDTPEGGQVFVKPFLHATNREMRRWRAEKGLPENEVSANLHVSGDCVCGAMADQDNYRSDREALRFFYPEVDAQITALEAECKRRGLFYCEWGVKRDDRPDRPDDGFDVCDGCDRRLFALDDPGGTSLPPELS